MKRLLILAAALAFGQAAVAQNDSDWAGYGRYAEANRSLERAPLVVFMGDSITDGWDDNCPDYFTSNNYLSRGISGQVSAQMLARFQSDVIALAPKAVVILAGTNDLARNNGYVPVEEIARTVASMAELARAHGIRPLICSVLPATDYPWRPDVRQVPDLIEELNARLRAYAERERIPYVDYYSALVDERRGLPAELGYDAVHPNVPGYERMAGILAPYLKKFGKGGK